MLKVLIPIFALMLLLSGYAGIQTAEHHAQIALADTGDDLFQEKACDQSIIARRIECTSDRRIKELLKTITPQGRKVFNEFSLDQLEFVMVLIGIEGLSSSEEDEEEIFLRLEGLREKRDALLEAFQEHKMRILKLPSSDQASIKKFLEENGREIMFLTALKEI